MKRFSIFLGLMVWWQGIGMVAIASPAVTPPSNMVSPQQAAPEAAPPVAPIPPAPPAPVAPPASAETTPTTAAPAEMNPPLAPTTAPTPTSAPPLAPEPGLEPIAAPPSAPLAAPSMPAAAPHPVASPIDITAAVGRVTGSTLRIVADRWCPYNCAPKAAAPGYMIELLTEIFNKQGVKIDYKIMTWSISLADTRRGNSDAAIGLNKVEAPDFIFPNETFGKYSIKAFTKVGSNFLYTDIASLDNRVLGIVQDYSYGPDVDNYIYSGTATKELFVVSGMDPIGTLVNSTLNNKVDVFLSEGAVVEYYLKLHQLQSQVGSAGVVSTKDQNGQPVELDLYVGFSPANTKSKDYAQIFDQGIRDLRASGELMTILKKYGLQDWTAAHEYGSPVH